MPAQWKCGLLVVLLLWIGIVILITAMAERPEAGPRRHALQQLAASLEPAARQGEATDMPAQESKDLASTLAALTRLTAANLALREDAEKAANWALWTVRLMGAVSFIVLGASMFGGYTLLASSKEQNSILDKCREARDSSQRTVGQINEDARKVTAVLDDMNERARTNVSNFERAFGAFDFSKLDAVVEALFIKEGTTLPEEERARLEDYDLRMRVGEMLGVSIAPDIYVKLGFYYRYVGQYGRAVVRFDRALQADPTILEAWLVKALCLAYLSRTDEERKGELLRRAFEEGIEKARHLRKDESGQFAFEFADGWLLDEVGKFPEAIRAYERARALSPHPHVDYNIACSLAKSGRPAEALKRLEIVGRETPKLFSVALDDPDFRSVLDDPLLGPRLSELAQRAQGEASPDGA